jgi:phospholipid/cholesterol/gamma-HCH transport system substrate-binding protein
MKMATTTPPPSSPLRPPPPAGPPRPVSAPPSRMRWVVVGALGLVVLIIAYLAFSSKGGGATYSFELENGSQLVLGDQVQVGGVPVGSVTGLTLTPAPSYKALVTISVNSSLTPLHEGTTAQVRVPSLTTVAGRYVALAPGPNNRPALPDGARLPNGSAQGTTDLDQLFDTLTPRTRKGLQELFVGTAEQYAGASVAAGLSAEYFAPALAAGTHILAELSRDQQMFTNFLVDSAKALSTIGAHAPELTSLVSNSNQYLQALGAEQSDLQRGVAKLPKVIDQGNRAFAQLPSTFAALRQLFKVAGPDTKTLAPLFERLTPLVHVAQPTLHELSLALSRPGPSNDLTDVALALPGLAQVLASGSPNDVKALQESAPITAFFGPYSPDLQGFFRDFGAAAGYSDANGNYARVSPVFDNFTLGANNTLTPASAQQALQGLKTKQLLRCPGAGASPPPADGSAPFTDNGQLGCDPTEVP